MIPDLAGRIARATVLFLLAAMPVAQQFLPRDRIPAIAGMPYRVHPFDSDGDGDADLFVSNVTGQPDRLLANDGSGGFTDLTAQLPFAGDWSRDAAFGDVDR